ncbi:hypothetical protein [Armatimonas sp.]|uniref:hypothetical protein n=1 Tax=Armatimonas sp. TaxID=1872638 RepID=UPI00286C1DB0|nr:hypothetical protein [Armatimonas sp.]
MKNQTAEVSIAKYSKSILLLILVIGMLLRLVWFFNGRSLWYDEACLATDIVRCDFYELLKPLVSGQSAPIPFLIITKQLFLILGHNDLVFRVFPLFSSLLSLLLFYRYCSFESNDILRIIPFGLLSLSYRAIYYGGEFKPYGVDLLVTIILLNLYNEIRRPADMGIARKTGVILAVLLCVWFSYPSIFVIFAIIIALIFDFNRMGMDLKSIVRHNSLGLIIIFGAVSFITEYMLVLRSTASKSIYLDFWDPMFLKMPFSLISVKQDTYLIYFLVQYPFQFMKILAVVFLIVFLIGLIAVLRTKKSEFIVFVLPIIFAGFASVLHKYGFGDRLMLFATPLICLLIGNGFQFVTDIISHKIIIKPSVIVLIALFCVLSAGMKSLDYIISPPVISNMRPLLEKVKPVIGNGEFVFVHGSSLPEYRFYSSVDPGLLFENVVLDENNPEEGIGIHLFNQIPPGGSCWLVLSKMGMPPYTEKENQVRFLGDITQRVEVPGSVAWQIKRR